MPVFSCGGMRYQFKWQDVPLDEVPPENQANLEATIRRSLELGIHHIETARGYGSSERQLGLVLPKIPRDQLIVQTKIAPTANPGDFVDDFHDSMSRLQLDYVDLLALHGVNTHQHLYWATRKGGCLDAARQLVDQGKVRFVGFSTHGPREVIQAAIEHDDSGGFDYVNLHWYYICQRNWPAIEAAHQRDMGVFIISPADKGGMLYRPTKQLIELCDPLHPLVFNCLFCLRRPEVHTLSLGASCPGDFDLQCSTLNLLDQADELVPTIVKRLEQALDQAVGSDIRRRFEEGLPGWSDTPGHINIGAILWLRQLLLAFDMREYAQMRYNLLGHGGHWFPGLNAQLCQQLDFTACLANSPYRDQIPAWLLDAHQQLYQAPKQRLSQS
ncbi:MAG: aldo/keto reductase [Pirellulaceae bacterium]